MYSDNNRRACSYRANDAFLRQMLGGELAGCHSHEKAPMPSARQSYDPQNPPCDGSINNMQHGCGKCPTEIGAPSLAMVYSPRQCWKEVLDPMTGWKHGSIFSELILPFEGCCKNVGTEVKTCR